MYATLAGCGESGSSTSARLIKGAGVVFLLGSLPPSLHFGALHLGGPASEVALPVTNLNSVAQTVALVLSRAARPSVALSDDSLTLPPQETRSVKLVLTPPLLLDAEGFLRAPETAASIKSEEEEREGGEEEEWKLGIVRPGGRTNLVALERRWRPVSACNFSEEALDFYTVPVGQQFSREVTVLNPHTFAAVFSAEWTPGVGFSCECVSEDVTAARAGPGVLTLPLRAGASAILRATYEPPRGTRGASASLLTLSIPGLPQRLVRPVTLTMSASTTANTGLNAQKLGPLRFSTVQI